VLSFANVIHLFAHELAGLRARRFAFARVLARAFDCAFFRHNSFEAVDMPPLDYARGLGYRQNLPRIHLRVDQSRRRLPEKCNFAVSRGRM